MYCSGSPVMAPEGSAGEVLGPGPSGAKAEYV